MNKTLNRQLISKRAKLKNDSARVKNTIAKLG
jgi:hypothetical protein